MCTGCDAVQRAMKEQQPICRVLEAADYARLDVTVVADSPAGAVAKLRGALERLEQRYPQPQPTPIPVAFLDALRNEPRCRVCQRADCNAPNDRTEH